jgi:hypothetical protein
MPVDQSTLQQRTLEQLLEDFSGVGPEQLKTLNLIWTVFQLIQAGGPIPSFADIPGEVADANGENLQAILEDLASRVLALENPA